MLPACALVTFAGSRQEQKLAACGLQPALRQVAETLPAAWETWLLECLMWEMSHHQEGMVSQKERRLQTYHGSTKRLHVSQRGSKKRWKNRPCDREGGNSHSSGSPQERCHKHFKKALAPFHHNCLRTLRAAAHQRSS